MNNKKLLFNIDTTLKHLFPINRSLTGKGVVETLLYLKKNFLKNAKIKKIRSGTKVFDWTIPNEWVVNDAYVKNRYGKKIIDFKKNNLHLMSYSSSFEGSLSTKDLLKKLHTIRKYPKRIPYRTSYYSKNWGFCCSHNLLRDKDFIEPFKVKIDVNFKKKGNLHWLEKYKKGRIKDEILISTYCCHPSLANDNLSGIVLASLLFNFLESLNTKFSYRLLIAPETIGAISFLSQANVKLIRGGMIVSCVGGPGKFSIKESFDKNHWINKAAHFALKKYTKNKYITYPFVPNGSDERQFSSPGFRIVTPSIHKSKYYEYNQYHTSADDLNFISSKNILKTLEIYKEWIKNIESFSIPKRKMKFCEYQLGKRNLYPIQGGAYNQNGEEKTNKKQLFSLNNELEIDAKHIDAFYWLMHLSDGKNSNFDISEISGIDLNIINSAIEHFFKKKLISL